MRGQSTLVSGQEHGQEVVVFFRDHLAHFIFRGYCLLTKCCLDFRECHAKQMCLLFFRLLGQTEISRGADEADRRDRAFRDVRGDSLCCCYP